MYIVSENVNLQWDWRHDEDRHPRSHNWRSFSDRVVHHLTAYHAVLQGWWQKFSAAYCEWNYWNVIAQRMEWLRTLSALCNNVIFRWPVGTRNTRIIVFFFSKPFLWILKCHKKRLLITRRALNQHMKAIFLCRQPTAEKSLAWQTAFRINMRFFFTSNKWAIWASSRRARLLI